MADIVKTSKVLSLVAEFTDGDERIINLENPKNDITAAQINALNAYAGGVLIGDKDKAAFKQFKTAKVITSTVTKLDLTTA